MVNKRMYLMIFVEGDYKNKDIISQSIEMNLLKREGKVCVELNRNLTSFS